MSQEADAQFLEELKGNLKRAQETVDALERKPSEEQRILKAQVEEQKTEITGLKYELSVVQNQLQDWIEWVQTAPYGYTATNRMDVDELETSEETKKDLKARENTQVIQLTDEGDQAEGSTPRIPTSPGKNPGSQLLKKNSAERGCQLCYKKDTILAKLCSKHNLCTSMLCWARAWILPTAEIKKIDKNTLVFTVEIPTDHGPPGEFVDYCPLCNSELFKQDINRKTIQKGATRIALLAKTDAPRASSDIHLLSRRVEEITVDISSKRPRGASVLKG